MEYFLGYPWKMQLLHFPWVSNNLYTEGIGLGLYLIGKMNFAQYDVFPYQPRYAYVVCCNYAGYFVIQSVFYLLTCKAHDDESPAKFSMTLQLNPTITPAVLQ